MRYVTRWVSVCLTVALIWYLYALSNSSGRLHRVVNGRGRYIIVGDIHGMNVHFMELLKKVRYVPFHDTVVCTGDVGNKGPDSEKVVTWLRKHDAISVKGNHDPYVSLTSKQNQQWLDSLPYSVYLSFHDILVVHAGIVPNISLSQQDPVMMTNLRTFVKGQPSSSPKGTPWVKYLKDNNPHIVFGHDARSGLQLTPKATGIDTGCVYGGRLTALILPSRERISVPCKKFVKP
eukprot:TRINITY_DN16767_c0_g1_i1.p1 TRINITY_DN16767_c0_g1~~TRINITY_DN16767_c0_g1_i1.p1  ORF type:complete len:233 (+),score=42.27 TRINITY_DN16767_c0_g1_i1:33-731(+)